MRSTRLVSLWFTFGQRVRRGEYAASGVALALLKYAGDVLIIRVGSGRWWTLFDYVTPLWALKSARFEASSSVLPLLAVWALPFLWIGVSMSMRRALDAGRSAWLALLFFIPVMNWIFIIAMCLLPSAPGEGRIIELESSREPFEKLRVAIAMATGVAIGVGMFGFSMFQDSAYSAPLFLGTPFVMGAITALLLNRGTPMSGRTTQQLVMATVAIAGGVLIAMGADGLICLFMAAPLTFGLAAMGASLGRHVAMHDRTRFAHAFIGLAVLPASALLHAHDAPSALREVRSAIEIDAPPDEVWRNVIAFPPLAEPRDVLFRAGISYPQRAEIVGSGVGAVRRCVFSTGAFVEPITRWEPGQRLSFNVDSQPPAMTELSPYAHLAPRHLDGYFLSRRGEFRLVALPGGRTRLEGSTWYEMRLQPEAYWVLFGDGIIHRIHGRVLEHIKAVTEQRRVTSPASSR